MRRCVDTVASWADDTGWDHEVVGDELFDLAPGHSGLPATDVARLVLLAERLEGGRPLVLWLDADVLVFRPSLLAPAPDPLAVCHEVWLTPTRAVELVCNAALSATSVAAVRSLLEDTLDTPVLGHRSLGPDLLTVRQRAAPLPTVPGVGVLSPYALRHLDRQPDLVRLGAVNLCASMLEVR